MSDDIKVKFSSDFSDLTKGAEQAAANAGTALNKSFTSAVGNLMSNIGSMFAVGSLATTFYGNFSRMGEYMKELDNIIKKTGVGAEDLQKLAKPAKESGVSLEQLGHALVHANKFLDEAKAKNGEQRRVLSDLKLATDETSLSNLNAVDVFYALADAVKNAGGVASQTQNIMTILGRSGAEMGSLFSKGADGIRAATEELKIYNAEEIEAAANAQRQKEKAESWFGRTFGGNQLIAFGKEMETNETANLLRGIIDKKYGTTMGAVTNDTIDKIMGSPGGVTQITDELVKEAGKRNISMKLLYSSLSNLTGEGSGDMGDLTAVILGQLNYRIQQANKKSVVSEVEAPVAAIMASTLQQIGGGDVSSVFAGIDYQKTTADAVTEANQHLSQIASNTDPNSAHQNQPPGKAGY